MKKILALVLIVVLAIGLLSVAANARGTRETISRMVTIDIYFQVPAKNNMLEAFNKMQPTVGAVTVFTLNDDYSKLTGQPFFWEDSDKYGHIKLYVKTGLNYRIDYYKLIPGKTMLEQGSKKLPNLKNNVTVYI